MRAEGYWTRIWPSATALSEYILSHQHLIRHKIVWELAAGLGLPSFFASFHARKVICSDNMPDAVRNMMDNIRLNSLKNVEAVRWDFLNDTNAPKADILLISDGNYDSRHHKQLQLLLLQQLAVGRDIILSTPQRLSGQGFLDPLMPYCKIEGMQYKPTDSNGKSVPVWVFNFKGTADKF